MELYAHVLARCFAPGKVPFATSYDRMKGRVGEKRKKPKEPLLYAKLTSHSLSLADSGP